MPAYVAIALCGPNQQAVLTSRVGEGTGLTIELRDLGIDLEKVHTIGLSYAHEKPPDVLAELITRAKRNVDEMDPKSNTRPPGAGFVSLGSTASARRIASAYASVRKWRQAKKTLKFLQDFQLEQSEKNITAFLGKSVTTRPIKEPYE